MIRQRGWGDRFGTLGSAKRRIFCSRSVTPLPAGSKSLQGWRPWRPLCLGAGAVLFRSLRCVLVPAFDEPIELPDGRKLTTLAEAMAWLAKEIPKSEHKMEKVQTAAHCVTQAAEHGGPLIFAQMGMLQAIHRAR
jgi:hypothetical protein